MRSPRKKADRFACIAFWKFHKGGLSTCFFLSFKRTRVEPKWTRSHDSENPTTGDFHFLNRETLDNYSAELLQERSSNNIEDGWQNTLT
ncbi:hypothetical protein CDAR_489221 [Caerostris darwini]|uniref:Uncharacterized protein n=1 Tax=Caerostris darwini TaxID=1538125 RepID=A0AAV4T4U5_9ARAC|nr:hypothetical protein CDAR_489221 [Caerostris darwini]